MKAEEFLKEFRGSNRVPLNPNDRIKDDIKKIIKEGNFVFDIHVHTFDKYCINEFYFITHFLKELIWNKNMITEENFKLINDNKNDLEVALKIF
ncbi:hypothetical protein PZ892_10495 [Sphingobacterium sp. WM]|uniref:hypothetical protein n=1 Tax=Sphingobacterium sp. WM TaxID=3031802 RepID=UPI00240D521E|nr:hypothetical protein [Sphingobacterium sp. WM]WFB62110.1 hypothetical protein PZ892_10495 [Sphingobacterium sp. WM]